jgi:hypothetical protein
MGMNPRLLRPTASGFNPKSIAGLLVWLDASDAATLGDQTTGPGGATDNGPVRYWGDKSGNGRHATNTGTLAGLPTLKTGALANKSVIAFDGGDAIGGAYDSVGLAIPLQTTFVVFRFDSATISSFGRALSQNAVSVQTGSGTGESGGYIPLLRNSSTSNFGGFRGSFQAGVTLTSGTWVAFQTRFQTTAIDSRIGLGSYVSSSSFSAYAATFNNYFIGSNAVPPSGGNFGGDIAEILIYGANLSNAEADRIQRYLLAKWSL